MKLLAPVMLCERYQTKQVSCGLENRGQIGMDSSLHRQDLGRSLVRDAALRILRKPPT